MPPTARTQPPETQPDPPTEADNPPTPASDVAPTAAPTTVAELESARDDEWNKYVADGAIYIYGQRAFNDGDPVPASHVDRDNAPVAREQVRLRSDETKG